MQSLTAQLQRRLDKHFIACAAAAVGVGTAAVEEGWAAVQYSGPQNIAVNTGNAYGIYLNFETGSVQNGIAGVTGFDVNLFSWRNQYPPTTGGFYPFVATFTGGGANNKVVGTGANKSSKLASGASIGAAGPFITSNYGFMVYGNPNLYGNWSAPADGFVGLKFQTSTDAGSDVHFGWMRIHIDPATGPSGPEASRYPTTLVDWAWETTANTPIAAGAGVPEPTAAAALGLLAIGSLGSRVWRKRTA